MLASNKQIQFSNLKIILSGVDTVLGKRTLFVDAGPAAIKRRRSNEPNAASVDSAEKARARGY